MGYHSFFRNVPGLCIAPALKVKWNVYSSLEYLESSKYVLVFVFSIFIVWLVKKVFEYDDVYFVTYKQTSFSEDAAAAGFNVIQ